MPENKETEEGPCTDWRPAAEGWRERAARNGIRIQLGHGSGSDPASSGSIQTADRGIERMTEEKEEYHIAGPDEDGYYSCEDCGHWFKVPDGEPVECPVCKQINEGPELKPCPFCGSDKVVLDWEMRDPDRWDNHQQIQARCMGCGAETDLFDTAAEAAARWNRRPCREGYKSGKLEACPFCAGRAVVKDFRDPELDESYNAAIYHVALCTECGNRANRSDDRYDPETTIDAWNKRTP